MVCALDPNWGWRASTAAGKLRGAHFYRMGSDPGGASLPKPEINWTTLIQGSLIFASHPGVFKTFFFFFFF